ncbi:MAG TPA: 5-(carboxyamino)imidazole ribonucleotide synthase [Gammaproteobacteria bacterium]|nr:5-(carboxyamino)imidazole ribonucleotide synthase [Gammaproteobacteria bacterium]
MSKDEPRVGIIGAGQLGRMLALAGYPLGIECVLLDKDPRSPGAQVAPSIAAELDDHDALRRLARGVDVVTLDIENVSIDALAALAGVAEIRPPVAAVAAAQDRLAEKELFRELGIPAAPFVAIDRAEDLGHAAALGWPLLLKTRRLGYDGRGQRLARSRDELEAAWAELGQRPAIAEGWVRFDRELSLVGARSSREAAFYPLAENTHRDGILVSTVAPFEDAKLQRQAESWLRAIFDRFDYRGVLTIELFSTRDGLLANEIAPRVHNSGHWTIEGAETSQFENHLRAVLDWPLGDTAARGYAGMLNLLGSMPPRERVLAFRGAHLHDYGKDPRPGRKLGHCTLLDGSRDRLLERLDELRAVLA